MVLKIVQRSHAVGGLLKPDIMRVAGRCFLHTQFAQAVFSLVHDQVIPKCVNRLKLHVRPMGDRFRPILAIGIHYRSLHQPKILRFLVSPDQEPVALVLYAVFDLRLPRLYQPKCPLRLRRRQVMNFRGILAVSLMNRNRLLRDFSNETKKRSSVS